MKVIYINLDPYLAAFAAWLNGGKSGPAPSFDPLPLAVTIPLGEEAAIAIPGTGTISDDFPSDEATIDGKTVVFGVETALPEGDVKISYQQTLGLSALVPLAQYAIIPWNAWEADNRNKVDIFVGENDNSGITIRFTVLVRRETASGPVDLVDFTPPASGAPSAADIKSALVAAGPGALAGVQLDGAIVVATGEEGSTLVSSTATVTPDSIHILNWGEGNSSTLGAAAS